MNTILKFSLLYNENVCLHKKFMKVIKFSCMKWICQFKYPFVNRIYNNIFGEITKTGVNIFDYWIVKKWPRQILSEILKRLDKRGIRVIHKILNILYDTGRYLELRLRSTYLKRCVLGNVRITDSLAWWIILWKCC